MMRAYHVAYNFTTTMGHGFGRRVVELDGPIRTHEDLKKIEKFIIDTVDDLKMTNVVILSWQELT